MKTIYLLIALVFTGWQVALAEEITVSGTGDSEKVLGILAKEFEKMNPDAKVNVPPSIGSGGGIKAVSEGKIDIARIARPLDESESKNGLTVVTYASSPIILAANDSVKKVSNITSAQIIGLYEGKISNWKDLGGEDQKLYLIVRESGDSSTMVLKNNIEGFSKIATLAGKTAYSTSEAVELVAKHPHTLGYLPLGAIVGEKVKHLAVDGVKPTAENISKGKYKLVVPFMFAYKGEPKATAKKFMDFVMKDAKARKILAENGVYIKK